MHAIWFEIPVSDLPRAKRFYESVFGHAPTDVIDQPERSITIIPGEPTVSLNRTAGFEPSAHGTLAYFQVDDVTTAISTALAHGGAVLEERNERPGFGWFARITDSEGNAIYVHSDH